MAKYESLERPLWCCGHNGELQHEASRLHAALVALYERRETSNVFFDWAADHHEPHFQQVPQAQARYSALREEFDGAVGDLQPEQLVGACRRTAAQPERSAE